MKNVEGRGARRMHDQHSLDEAEMRRDQQRAAGDSHRPLEAMPPLGGQPLASDDSARLRRDYEESLRREREAWACVRGLPGETGFSEDAWEDWRDAVDARDKATRLLVNQGLDRARAR
jgi:hypothetical protein